MPFGIGPGELIIVLIIALLVIGPVLADGRARDAPAGGRPGGGLLVNVSRAIAAEAHAAADPGEALRAAAADWARRLPVLP